MFADEEPDPDELRTFVTDVVVPNVNGQLEDTRALEPPEDIDGDVNAVLDEADEVVDGLADRAEDDPEALFSGEDPFAGINPGLEALGLTECANAEDGQGVDESVLADITPKPPRTRTARSSGRSIPPSMRRSKAEPPRTKH